jgi:hypothetical protein
MSAVYLYTFQGPYQKTALVFEEQKVFIMKKKKQRIFIDFSLGDV